MSGDWIMCAALSINRSYRRLCTCSFKPRQQNTRVHSIPFITNVQRCFQFFWRVLQTCCQRSSQWCCLPLRSMILWLGASCSSMVKLRNSNNSWTIWFAKPTLRLNMHSHVTEADILNEQRTFDQSRSLWLQAASGFWDWTMWIHLVSWISKRTQPKQDKESQAGHICAFWYLRISQNSPSWSGDHLVANQKFKQLPQSGTAMAAVSGSPLNSFDQITWGWTFIEAHDQCPQMWTHNLYAALIMTHKHM